MKKVFEDDSSYIDISQTSKDGKVVITLCARHSDKSDNVTMVSVEMDEKEFRELVEKSL
jgi:hypothetical protein